MSTIAKENLDERIERIKKRNEEIEKKYREAEEDRLRALKENAMVETKPPKDDDWPRTHKYDKIDFTYDVKPEKLEELNNQKLEEKKQKRDYKKFPEGEGPPPDPAYNFLADAERDGLIIQKPEKGSGKDKDSKQNNNNKGKDQQQRRGGPNAGSFRGRGGKMHSPKYQKQNSQPDYEQWRSEREKIDEARINRQKVGEGKWRREWDNDKLNSENEALLRPERATIGDAIINAKKSPTHHHANAVEKRGNITVSVSQTGEVKSVKLTSAPVIGTGRVGPRQVTKPQFSIQAVEKDLSINKAPHSPKPQQKSAHRQNANPNSNFPQPNKNITRRDTAPSVVNANSTVINTQPPSAAKNTKPNKPKSSKFSAPSAAVTVPNVAAVPHPLVADLPSESAGDLLAIDLSHKPEFAKKSVQDRLMRIRQVSQTNDTAPAAADQPNSPIADNVASVESGEVLASPVSSDIVNDSDKTEESMAPIDKAPNNETNSVGPERKENITESNKSSCDLITESENAAEADSGEQKVNCDTISNETIVSVSAASEAIAAN